jgi:hypothetical protein
MEWILLSFYLTGSTGFIGSVLFSDRFPEECDEKHSASGRKDSLSCESRPKCNCINEESMH